MNNVNDSTPSAFANRLSPHQTASIKCPVLSVRSGSIFIRASVDKPYKRLRGLHRTAFIVPI